MSTIRHFSGNRATSKNSVAREILILEMQKKGKLPAAMRYKMIFKRKQEESRAKAAQGYGKQIAGASGQLVGQRKMSTKAEQALKEMAMKKAAKEAKKLRQMVIVRPQNFKNGRIDAKGQIFDIAGNLVGRVNTKNGAMSASTGWGIGKYKPKSYMTTLLIEQAIDRYSPYFIQQRKLAMMQAAMSNVHGSYVDPNVMNVHGISAAGAMLGGGMYGNTGSGDYGVHGYDPNAPQSNFNGNVTAWGAMSNNTWGTFSNNVHGTVGDNVHGTVNSDVWGSVAGPSLWGQRGVRMYGTGGGVNHLTSLTKFILGLFGYQSKAAREAQRDARLVRAAMANSAPRVAAPRRR